MERKFKHKKTGEIISYKEGVIKSGSFVFELGCEPSKEYWEEIKKELPIGTKITQVRNIESIKVTVSVKTIYFKFAEIEVDVDDKLFEDEGQLQEYLRDNQEIDTKIGEAFSAQSLQWEDTEYRYDCPEKNTGGHF